VNPPIIITGMHRSGTSLLASLLQQAGLDIGQRLVEANPGNKRGHFEDEDFVILHNDILAAHQTTMYLDNAPHRFEITPQLRQRAEKLLASRSTSQNWGWKDPRTVLFLDFWKELVPGLKVIILYRSAEQVVDSLRRRGDRVLQHEFRGSFLLRHLGFSMFRMRSAVNMWLAYNRAMISFIERQDDSSTVLISADDVVNHPACVLNLINERIHIGLVSIDVDAFVDATQFKTDVAPSVRRACRGRAVRQMTAKLQTLASRLDSPVVD
jgi:hypothetical protein